jgi:PAS domain S-box-containing protein
MPLKYRLAVIMVVLTAGVIAVVLWQTLAHLQHASHGQLASTEEALLILLHDASRAALLTEEYTGLAAYFERLQRHPNVERLLLADVHKRIVVSLAPSLRGTLLPPLRDSPERHWRTVEIVNLSEPLGELAVEFSRRPVLQATRQARNAGLSIAVLGLVCMAMAATGIGLLLSRRVQRLTQAVQRLGAGDWRVSSGLQGHDEIGRLGHAFDTMAHQMAVERAQLAAAQQQLQQELRERQQVQEALQQRLSALTAQESTHRQERLTSILEINKRIASSADQAELLSSIAQEAARLVGADGASVRILRGDRLVAIGKSQHGSVVAQVPEVRLGEGTAGRTVQENRVIVVADIQAHPDVTPAYKAAAAAAGLHSFVNIPIGNSRGVIGVLAITSKQPRVFTDDEIVILTTYAEQAAIAIERTQLLENIRQQTADLTQINVALQHEIAERQRTETALRESELRYRTLVEGSLQGIAIVNQEGMRLFANQALATMFGYESPKEIIGQPVFNQIAPHDRQRLREYLAAFRRGEAVPVRYECQGVRQDGSVIWLEARIARVVWEGEAAVQSALLDSTERKNLEAQLLQVRKMEAIGTLAGGIAHDFNNILAAILGYTELALLDVPQDSPVWRSLQEVLTAGIRARDLVQQILAFSRQSTPQRQPVFLHLLVKEVLRLLRASLPSTIDIRQQLDAQAGTVLADPTQMHQVLMNLGANAEYAMRPAGGVLEVRLEAVQVDATLTTLHPSLQPGPYVRLVVRDTGHGMTPEVVARIFDPFFTTKGIGEGSGMGLAVVHGIVMNHNGVITVSSTPGQGTTFAIYLPRTDDLAQAVTPRDEATPGGHERILLIEDEPALARLGQGLLRSLGYDVVVSSHSPEVLEIFRSAPQHFDLVITDQTMPHMTGESLVQELRRLRANIPIILCTGFSHVLSAEKAQALGVQALLIKPLTTRDLALAIRQALAYQPAEDTG